MTGEHCKYERELTTLIEKTKNLEGWQKRQNGSIGRIEEKVDATLAVVNRMEGADEKSNVLKGFGFQKTRNYQDRVSLVIAGVAVAIALAGIFLR